MMLIQALPQRQNLDKYLEVSGLTQLHNNRWFKYKILIGKSPGESLPPCRGLWGTLHTGDDIDCNTCLLWEC